MFRCCRLIVVVVAAAMLMLTVPVGLGGCAGPAHTIDAGAIDNNLTNVCTRHDAYVQADQSLSATQREIYLNTSKGLLRLQDTAMGRQTTTNPAAPATGPPR